MKITICVTFKLMFLLATIGLAQDNPRHVLLGPGVDSFQTLEQNWTDEVSNWFYRVPQGSRLLPYDWFVALEQPDSTELFIAARHVRDLGYIACKPSSGNPDGLPIGFTKDASYEDGTEAVGMTCAACHTGQITFDGTAYLVDGAPTMGDFERLLRTLTKSLQNTANDDDKFARFATRILPSSASDDLKKDLRASLQLMANQRDDYDQRNLSKDDQHRYGPGRVDAFGAIFNEVTANFLRLPENAETADAPVSYPCLWDTPQHDRVQWNGAAENRESILAIPLFGTEKIGALGRNAGEVLGVFGNARINEHELILPRPYASTVNKDNLLAIEASLESLWSPEWPFPQHPIEEARRERGKTIYDQSCSRCHAHIDRADEDRIIEARFSFEGTDSTMLRNFGRTSKTGNLEHRLKTILGRERFQAEDRNGIILKHVVERAILNPLLASQLKSQLAAARESGSADAFNPGYQNTAVVTVGQEVIQISVDALIEEANSIKIESSKTEILAFANELGKNLLHEIPTVGEESLETLESVASRLGNRLKLSGLPEEASPTAEVPEASATLAYKSRPLNGIWATAPYLHNGSVPTLAELLKAPAERMKSFHVGSMEFDPVNVGFVDDANFPVFDTLIEGNSNAGHNHGSELTPEQKLDLLEYLKSL